MDENKEFQASENTEETLNSEAEAINNEDIVQENSSVVFADELAEIEDNAVSPVEYGEAVKPKKKHFIQIPVIISLVIVVGVALGFLIFKCFFNTSIVGTWAIEDPTQSEATADEATSDEATADEATSDEATADEATPDEATPDEATPDEATPDEATPDEVVIYGDVNGDGEVSSADRMTLARYLAKWTGYDTIDAQAADVDGNGKVDSKDRMILARYLAKWSGYETLPYNG